tara:strand:- start:2737 stop:3807 length:1071 start_codon:yes stop_codon:yes gene_type:complete
MRGWRRLFVFNILLLVIGSGVITNGLLKEYWGRPRPREVEGLGGHSQFEQVLTIDRSSEGKSFPCGHATMGFYFVGGFFLLRRHRRKLAESMLAFGIGFGVLMGIARMAKGGHFFSDVVWAGAVCYFTAMGLFYLLKLHRGVWRVPKDRGKMPLLLKLGILLISVTVIAAILLATPYRDQRNLFLVNEASKEKPLIVQLFLTFGEHDIDGGDEFLITGDAYGHGVPTSRIAPYFEERLNGGIASVVYHERISGWFFEVNEQLQFLIPWNNVPRLEIDSGDADLWIELDETDGNPEIVVSKGRGVIKISLAGQSLQFDGDLDLKIKGRALLVPVSETLGGFTLRVGEEFEGMIEIKN